MEMTYNKDTHKNCKQWMEDVIYVHTDMANGNTLNEDSMKAVNDAEYIIELLDRAEPQKPLFSDRDGEYYCQRCHAEIPSTAVYKELAFRGITYCSECGQKHDWSKRNELYRSMFYRDLCNTIEGKIDFINGEWSKFHYETERHHLLRNVPEDVNLIDVIEMIADYVCAGMARSGEVRPLEIDEKILVTAMNNTVKMLADAIEVEE